MPLKFKSLMRWKKFNMKKQSLLVLMKEVLLIFLKENTQLTLRISSILALLLLKEDNKYKKY